MSIIPTPKLAKEFSENLIRKNIEKLKASYILLHSQFVIKAVKDLIEKKNLKFDLEQFEIAGYFHDVRYILEEEKHAEKSLEIVSEKFILNKILEDCILNHGSSAKPQTQEGKIFQLADKLSASYPEFVKKWFELEKQEGLLSDNEIKEKINKKLEKYLEIFEDKDYRKIAKENYKKSIEE